MMPTSARRVNAATWIVLEISSSAARAWTSASANVTLRTPSRKSKSSGEDVALVVDVAHADLAVMACCGRPVHRRPGRSSLTRSVAGSVCGRTTLG